MELAEKIKIRRKQKGISQKELADRIGVAQATINKIENGNTKNTSVEIAFKIAKALDENVYDLFGDGITEDSSRNKNQFELEKQSKQLILVNYVLQTMQDIKHYNELSINENLSEEERKKYKKWSLNVNEGLLQSLKIYKEAKTIDSADILRIINYYPTWPEWKDFMTEIKYLLTD